MRGWSFHAFAFCERTIVIPANAGVILSQIHMNNFINSYPRECGGDPFERFIKDNASTLSPRMRGWSRAGAFLHVFLDVIPANAGVILEISPQDFILKSYPRECGGDPPK